MFTLIQSLWFLLGTDEKRVEMIVQSLNNEFIQYLEIDPQKNIHDAYMKTVYKNPYYIKADVTYDWHETALENNETPRVKKRNIII